MERLAGQVITNKRLSRDKYFNLIEHAAGNGIIEGTSDRNLGADCLIVYTGHRSH